MGRPSFEVGHLADGSERNQPGLFFLAKKIEPDPHFFGVAGVESELIDFPAVANRQGLKWRHRSRRAISGREFHGSIRSLSLSVGRWRAGERASP